MTKKKNGYVLAVVMLFAFLLAAVTVTTYTICYRYHLSSKRRMEQLRQDVYFPVEQTSQTENNPTSLWILDEKGQA